MVTHIYIPSGLEFILQCVYVLLFKIVAIIADWSKKSEHIRHRTGFLNYKVCFQ